MDPTELIDFASDPAFGLDHEMRVTGWNSGAEKLLGYTAQETAGKSCGRVLQASYDSGEPLCSVLCEGRACISGGEKWGLASCNIRHKDGTLVPTAISSLVLPHEARSTGDGKTVAVIFLRQSSEIVTQGSVDIPLRVFALGRFSLASFGQGLKVDTWKRKKAAIALKILISQIDRPVHRERLIDWLWPEADAKSGWASLKVTISFLRAQLRDAGLPNNVVETVGQSYIVKRSSVWVDADVFERLVTDGWEALDAGENGVSRRLFEDAESLYRGELFEDEPYADWCAVERERLIEIQLEMYEGMAQGHTKAGRFLEAGRVCRLALAIDPCRESFIRTLMDSLVAMGRNDWARAHFVSWQRRLQEHYDIKPTRETWSAYTELVEEAFLEARATA